MKKSILVLIILAFAIPATAMACPGAGQGMRGKHFEQMDSNGDGTISAKEHAAAAAKRFSMMDSNGDGKLSNEEMMQKWNRHHPGWDNGCPMGENCPAGKGCPMGQDCPAGKECPLDKQA